MHAADTHVSMHVRTGLLDYTPNRNRNHLGKLYTHRTVFVLAISVLTFALVFNFSLSSSFNFVYTNYTVPTSGFNSTYNAGSDANCSFHWTNYSILRMAMLWVERRAQLRTQQNSTDFDSWEISFTTTTHAPIFVHSKMFAMKNLHNVKMMST